MDEIENEQLSEQIDGELWQSAWPLFSLLEWQLGGHLWSQLSAQIQRLE